MITYPNQKIVTVDKPLVDIKSVSKTMIPTNELFAAARALNGVAFKIWIYVMANKNGWEFALSNDAIEAAMGIPGSSFKAAIRELKECGYLTRVKGNRYVMSLFPRAEGVAKKTNKRKDRNNTLSEAENILLGDKNNTLSGSETNQEIMKDSEYIMNNSEDSPPSANLIYSPEVEDASVSGSGDISNTRTDTHTESMADIKPVHSGPWYVRTPWDILERERKVRERDLSRFENWEDEHAYREVLKLLTEYGYLSDNKRRIKHGVRIDGWNEETNEPMFTVGVLYVPPRLMRQKIGVCKDVLDRLKAKHSRSLFPVGETDLPF